MKRTCGPRLHYSTMGQEQLDKPYSTLCVATRTCAAPASSSPDPGTHAPRSLCHLSPAATQFESTTQRHSEPPSIKLEGEWHKRSTTAHVQSTMWQSKTTISTSHRTMKTYRVKHRMSQMTLRLDAVQEAATPKEPAQMCQVKLTKSCRDDERGRLRT
jgi:hypothetical protein